MTTDTTDVDVRTDTTSLSTNIVFELLLDEQRRDVLYYLSQKVGAVSIDELTAQLTHGSDNPTRDRLEEITTEFYHAHLPKLIDAAVVRYDPDAGTVERRAAAAALDPYLELAQQQR